MTSITTQPPKKDRSYRKPRVWVWCSAKEKRAMRAVTKAEGLAKGEVLRRYSLNDIVEKARLLDGNNKA